MRRFEEALPFLRASVAALSDYSGHHHSLICCCGHLGLLEEARQVLSARNRISPPMRRSVIAARLEGFAYRDVFMKGLEKAGAPE
jgi:adenylate cyclase